MLTMSTANPVSDERAVRQLPSLPKTKSAGSGSGSGSGKSKSPTRDFKQIDIPNLPPLVPRDPDELSARRVQARPTKVHTAPNMHAMSRFEDNRPKEFNTEPLPYQPQYFKSSTMLKKVSIPKRHQDTFGGKDVEMTRQKEVIIHTERYQRESEMFGMIGRWDVESDKNPPVQPPLPILSYVQTPNLQVTKNTYNFNKIRQQYNLNRESQRERHQAEKDYVESMRGLKRKREVLPHRAPLDLLMGGKRAEFNERESITDELNRLKSIVLPANARDLYHGRGIKLPTQHASVSPRRPMPPDEAIIGTVNRNSVQHPSGIHSVTTSAPATLVREPLSHQPKLSRKANTFVSQTSHKKSLPVIPPIKRQATLPDPKPEPKPDPRPPVVAKKEESIVMREPSPPSPPSPVAEYNPILGVLDPSRRSSSIAPRTPRVPVFSDDDDLHDHSRGPSRTLPPPSLDVQQVDAADEDKMEVDPPPEDATGQKTPESEPVGLKSTTPNPLKGVDLTSVVPADQRQELEVIFNNLDTDNDGHLKYNEVTRVLPEGLSNAQQRYIKQVYDITSASTFFGVNEFVTLSCLCQKMATLSGAAQEAYEKLNFATLQTSVLQYVELFQSVDRNEKGKVSIESLEEILSTLLEKTKTDNQEFFQELKQVVDINDEDCVTKIDYIAHIPYFLSLQQMS